jgi:hypothetical protein
MVMYLAVQELAQRTTMVRALALVATSRSPARTPALISSWPGRRKMLSVPGCRLPLEKPVGEIRRVAGAESGRHEAGALDADAALHGRGMGPPDPLLRGHPEQGPGPWQQAFGQNGPGNPALGDWSYWTSRSRRPRDPVIGVIR